MRENKNTTHQNHVFSVEFLLSFNCVCMRENKNTTHQNHVFSVEFLLSFNWQLHEGEQEHNTPEPCIQCWVLVIFQLTTAWGRTRTQHTRTMYSVLSSCYLSTDNCMRENKNTTHQNHVFSVEFLLSFNWQLHEGEQEHNTPEPCIQCWVLVIFQLTTAWGRTRTKHTRTMYSVLSSCYLSTDNCMRENKNTTHQNHVFSVEFLLSFNWQLHEGEQEHNTPEPCIQCWVLVIFQLTTAWGRTRTQHTRTMYSVLSSCYLSQTNHNCCNWYISACEREEEQPNNNRLFPEGYDLPVGCPQPICCGRAPWEITIITASGDLEVTRMASSHWVPVGSQAGDAELNYWQHMVELPDNYFHYLAVEIL